MRRATLLLATVFIASAPALAKEPVTVPLDQVRLVTFAHPVSTIYVANPSVADVTMTDSRHGFVLGKAFGATNIVALDANGHQISDAEVVVAGGSGAMVTLQKGPDQTTYTCAAQRCEMTPQPGDSKDAFGLASAELQSHQQMISKAATPQ